MTGSAHGMPVQPCPLPPPPAPVTSAWLQKMEEYLGCTPENDAQGVLQDVHWSAGLFG